MKKPCVHVDCLFQLKYPFLSDIDNFQTNFSTSETNKNESDSLVDSNRVVKKSELERLFDLIVQFYHPSKNIEQARLRSENSKNFNYFFCRDCAEQSRLWNRKTNVSERFYMCAICLFIGCFNLNDKSSHAHLHSVKENHDLFIDLVYGYVFCFKCNDFQYNEHFETIAKNCFGKLNLLQFGKFSEWEPSQNVLILLKNFTVYFMPKKEEENQKENVFELFKLKSSSIIGLRGLLNLGNTCFMNCILQTLTHTPTLRDYFLSDKHICMRNNKNATSSCENGKYNGNHTNSIKQCCLVCELVMLFQEFYSGKRSPHMPYNLLHQVWTQVKHLAGYEQQDAHEFFIAILNAMHKNCIENDKECIVLNSKQTNFTNYNNCHCIIDKIFTGGLQSDVICSHCNYISTKVDPFWDISLDLGNNMNKNLNEQSKTNNQQQQKNDLESRLREPLNLEDCLQRFTLPEVLTSFNCSFCKFTKEAKKQLTMKNLPTVCCFHLKRFEQSHKIHKKISNHISFSEILDMSPFMSKQSNTNSTESSFKNSNKYFLFAVVNHHGSLESGHYTSFIRLTQNQWFKCDDHIISKASLNDVMKSEGYLLFYHKIWNDFDSN